MASVGRPRTFDRDDALNKAMLIFWEKGYEGTTMTDIINVIGTKAPSVYAAFGNKDKLFNEVVNLYAEILKAGPLKALNDHSSIYDAIRSSLYSNVEIFTSSNNPCSCLIMTAANNCSPEHSEHMSNLKNLRTNYKRAIEVRFQQAVADGQLISSANPQTLAEYYMTFVHGLALRAKDGVNKSELLTSTDYALVTVKLMLK
ncbi:TetR/AcrR family transcriptional regulator [Methylotenera mobilis]|uniref:Transcriptional regulator, TetR family n=1 Tax=Methylotenera mobilis (strain JLW8 / ATCC BAA-1282 / DSM 17540) TaxID=583345 RepID=C6WVQ5_METML|nr:TetR/AcrR family transcriptional regulator [Methylotenera mobilis]ACT48004.1 transcriptional regulator, TetR family [Methylotenera mobilis JLW8]